MDSVLAVKLNSNPTNPRLGYIKALLASIEGNWTEATNLNVPKASEIFVSFLA